MRKISIVGIGWLGLQVAEKLLKSGYEVVGTVTAASKKNQLSQKFNEVNQFDINNFNFDEEILTTFQEVDCFILTIPPSASQQYAVKMNELITQLAMQNPLANFIYTSSTSVYGNKVREVNEESPTQAESANAKEIVKIENHLLKNYPSKSIVLRMGGLVGHDKHPINYLSGRANLSKGQAPVNLVHAEDICKLISFFLENNIEKGIYNLCCEEHPTKEEYYCWAAKQFNISSPNFNPLDNQKDKTVFCNAIKSINFEMMFKSPYDFPISNKA